VTKDAFDGLSEVVPRSIASGGVRERRPAGHRRPDRPLGRQGIDLLGQVPLFSSLSRRHLRQLAEHADIVSFRERETIVETGQPGGTFYVILEGEAKVVRGTRTLGRLDPGDFFGEISLLDGGPRSATVTTETPVTLVMIDRASFHRLLRSDSDLALGVMASLARMIRRVDRSTER